MSTIVFKKEYLINVSSFLSFLNTCSSFPANQIFFEATWNTQFFLKPLGSHLKNICEQNTRLFLSQIFEPPLTSTERQHRCLRQPRGVVPTTPAERERDSSGFWGGAWWNPWLGWPASHPKSGSGVTARPPQPDLGWLASHPSCGFLYAPPQNRILMPQHLFLDSKLKPRGEK